MKKPKKRSDLELEFARHLELAKIPVWQEEYKFASSIGRKWRFDFAWPIFKVAVEIEGGTWIMGRHQRPYGFAKDAEKYNAAAGMGWKVFRFTGEMVRSGEALKITEKALKGEER